MPNSLFIQKILDVKGLTAFVNASSVAMPSTAPGQVKVGIEYNNRSTKVKFSTDIRKLVMEHQLFVIIEDILSTHLNKGD